MYAEQEVQDRYDYINDNVCVGGQDARIEVAPGTVA